MKTTMKQLTAGTILGLLLIAVNVNAGAKGTTKASSLENIETTIELESWMIDETVWTVESSFYMEDATEESLDLEAWMVDDENWNNIISFENETETDNSLELESWMTYSPIWNR